MKGGDSMNCEDVVAVERTIVNPINIVEIIINELIKGPNPLEAENYITSIDSSVGINKIEVRGDSIVVDFTKKLSETTAGSCDVGATNAQIKRTLQSIPGVYSTIIMVDGAWEGILEP